MLYLKKTIEFIAIKGMDYWKRSLQWFFTLKGKGFSKDFGYAYSENRYN